MGLGCTFAVGGVAGEGDIGFAAVNLRERISNDYHTLARSPYQRVYDLMSFKRRREQTMGKLSAKSLAEEWNRCAKMSADSEEVSAEYVTAVISVHERALSSDPVRGVVEALEQRYGMRSPFDSIYKMHALVKKVGKNTPTLSWTFEMILDRIDAKVMSPRDFSMKALAGDSAGGGGGGRGLADLFSLKLDMKVYLSTRGLDKLNYGTEIKNNLASAFASIATYRARLNPLPVEVDGVMVATAPDLTWQKDWPPSLCKYAAFLESVVFGEENDSTLRTACRASKTPVDVMAFPSMKAVEDDITSMRQKEIADASALSLPAPAGEPSPAGAGAVGSNGNVDAGAGGGQAPQDALELEARRVVFRHVALAVEPENQVELKHQIMSSSFKSLFGSASASCPAILARS